MHLTKIFLSCVTIVFFISCGDNTLETVTSDIADLKIDQANPTAVYATDELNLTATVTFEDGTFADATNSASWDHYDKEDYNITSLSLNMVVPAANSGESDVTAGYKNLADFNDTITVEIISLTDFNITSAEITTTGDHILEATGSFEDGTVDKVLVRNITWVSTNSNDAITYEDNIATINIDGTGERNITASLFTATDDENNITVTYTAE